MDNIHTLLDEFNERNEKINQLLMQQDFLNINNCSKKRRLKKNIPKITTSFKHKNFEPISHKSITLDSPYKDCSPTCNSPSKTTFKICTPYKDKLVKSEIQFSYQKPYTSIIDQFQAEKLVQQAIESVKIQLNEFVQQQQ